MEFLCCFSAKNFFTKLFSFKIGASDKSKEEISFALAYKF